MNKLQEEHLTEEQLMDIASGGENTEAKVHLNMCEECSREAHELKKISSMLAGIDDEEVPGHIERRILRSVESKKTGIVGLLENPMLSIIIAVLVIFMLYMVIGILLIDQ